MSATHFIALISAGSFAGFVDAIVGGGGLIAIPALLLTGLPVHAALGTNKFAGTFGVLTSTAVYWRQKLVRLRSWIWLAALALSGAILGTITIILFAALASDFLNILLPILLLFALIMVVFRRLPKMPIGGKKINKFQYVIGGTAGFGLGFYDGFLGPGTGALWLSLLTSIFKLDLLKATAIAKFMNFISNVAALSLFILSGSVHYFSGIVLTAGYVTGSFLGAKSAIVKGSKLIKPLFLVVCIALLLKWMMR